MMRCVHCLELITSNARHVNSRGSWCEASPYWGKTLNRKETWCTVVAMSDSCDLEIWAKGFKSKPSAWYKVDIKPSKQFYEIAQED